MNIDFKEPNKSNMNITKQLQKLNIHQIDENEWTCTRGKKRSLDHIFSTGKKLQRTEIKEIKTSDHRMVISNIELKMEKIERDDKEMVFSNQVNEPRMKQL